MVEQELRVQLYSALCPVVGAALLSVVPRFATVEPGRSKVPWDETALSGFNESIHSVQY